MQEGKLTGVVVQDPEPGTGGVLPTVLLAVLMMLSPVILRALARFEGIPKLMGLELSLVTRYCMFFFVVSPLFDSIRFCG